MSRIVCVAILVVVFGTPGNAQPCNPAIDGTYCAEMGRKPVVSTPPSRSSLAIEGLGSSLMPTPYDQPATLGAITFSGDGSRCIGLLRRVNCN